LAGLFQKKGEESFGVEVGGGGTDPATSYVREKKGKSRFLLYFFFGKGEKHLLRRWAQKEREEGGNKN